MENEIKEIDRIIATIREVIKLSNRDIELLESDKQKIIAESSNKPYCPKCFTLDVLYIKNMPTENKMVCRQYGCFYDGSEEEFHYQ